MASPKKVKPGKVVRLTPDLVTLVMTERKLGESIPSVIRRLLNLTGEVRYVLPSDLHESIADAKGTAVLRAVRSKSKGIERPIPVRAQAK
jgi:hypothetical protein